MYMYVTFQKTVYVIIVCVHHMMSSVGYNDSQCC